MEKHTPTPWEIICEGISGYTIRHADTYHEIARVNPTYKHEEDGGDLENAEFIVRAVNSHGELMEAAKELINEAREGDIITGYEGFIRLKKAIAKAEGK